MVPFDFVEFIFDRLSLPNLHDGYFKGPWSADSRLHLLLKFFAQMTFQFFKRQRLDSPGEHLLSPLRDGLLEVKHFLTKGFWDCEPLSWKATRKEKTSPRHSSRFLIDEKRP